MSQERPFVVGEDVFKFLVVQEVRKALRLQYLFSVITVVVDRSSTEPGYAPVDVESLVASVSRVVRAADVIGISPGQQALRVLLIGADLEASDIVVARIQSELPPEFRVRFGLACFPATATTHEELLRRADAEAGLIVR